MRSQHPEEAKCETRVDRMIVGVPENPPNGVPRPKGFKLLKDSWVRPRGAIRTYERVRWYKSKTNSCKISIEYKRLAPWMPWCKITIYPDDRTGLTLEEIKNVLVDIPEHNISLLELAFDFHPSTGIDAQFVRQNMRFGKSRLRENWEKPDELRYGSRGSPKMVRCYFKKEIGRHRVELELHSSLLKLLAIRNVADLPNIAGKLCPAHISFERIDWDKLDPFLIRKHGRREGWRLYTYARNQSQASLSQAKRFLSSRVHNVHRFVVPTIRNREIRQALQRWERKFRLADTNPELPLTMPA